MARIFLKCYDLCVYFVIFTWISAVGCSTDFSGDVQYFEDYGPEVYSLQSHRIHKKLAPEIHPKLTVDIVTSTESSIKKDYTTIKKTKKYEKITITSAMSGEVGHQENLTENLGENGAGQRKNISFTYNILHPSLVHHTAPTAWIENKKVNNITNSKTDENRYYKSTVYNDRKIGQFYWVNMSERSDVKVNDLLSDSYRRAATVKLSFEFPFYGYLITNVTIATGGFLFTGDSVHSWLTVTQYIAPLMANFETSLSNDSLIKYIDNGTAFTVEWEKVTLQDKPKDGEFTFQVTLFKNGDIVFVYKEIPLLVEEIQELHHPVKVGLSDAYVMDRRVFLVRRKTFNEYDRVHLNKTDVKDWSAIYLKVLPTCLDAQDCVSCLSRDLGFKCQWCPAMSKCSRGFDRYRQDWLAQGCDKTSVSNSSMCSIAHENQHYKTNSVYDTSVNVQSDTNNEINVQQSLLTGSEDKRVGISGIMAVIFLVSIIMALVSWVFYAYRNPHTPSGQILIRYQPSQWRWRRG